jgi:Domain of unknown function (DUF4388)
MSLFSSFTDFSLAELFQLIDQGRKSGCLTVSISRNPLAAKPISQFYNIWFRQGRVVAAANRLNGQGLVSKIIERGWANPQVLEKLCSGSSTGIPLGLQLKTQEVLSAEQLNLLFASQLQYVRELFEIQKGVFQLDSKAALPSNEMTGLSLRAIEVSLLALRALKNWEVLGDVLPNVNCAIKSITQTKPQIRLHAFEWQVWEFANGTVSVGAIASQLQQPTVLVQQAALRLMVAGLVEEVPLVESMPELNDYPIDSSLVNSSGLKAKKSKEPEPLNISASFLPNLVGFLKSKT